MKRLLAARWLLPAILAALTGCVPAQQDAPVVPHPPARGAAKAIFAGGCFWCMEKDFEQLPGVIEAESGYTAGHTENPDYRSVSAGITGHTEAVRVTYDPARVSYSQLVEYFWRHIDPTVKDRQFCDVGSQYRSGIYWQDERERQVAEASRDALLASGRFTVIHTELAPATRFWPAEAAHQDYYKKNPLRYAYYRAGCGRDARVEKVWGARE
jgi:peptide-methionine (S)-S-oxide reductase